MAISIETIQQLGLTSAEVKPSPKQELGQDQFLKLMTTQMTHQDPTSPMENGDFLAQMAQFSTVEGIGALNDSFEGLASSMTSNQSLQAAGLVGNSVSYVGREGILSVDKPLKGSVDLKGATAQLTVEITDKSGRLVKSLNLGQQAAGKVEFEWDGLLDDESYALPDSYYVDAQAVIHDKNTALETQMYAEVESVDLGNVQKGVLLNLGGLGQVQLGDIKQIF